jgi:phage shock protein A
MEAARKLEEQLVHLQRHVEQQDRAMLDLTRELERLRQRIERLETKPANEGDTAAGSPADERPPHW